MFAQYIKLIELIFKYSFAHLECSVPYYSLKHKNLHYILYTCSSQKHVRRSGWNEHLRGNIKNSVWLTEKKVGVELDILWVSESKSILEKKVKSNDAVSIVDECQKWPSRVSDSANTGEN